MTDLRVGFGRPLFFVEISFVKIFRNLANGRYWLEDIAAELTNVRFRGVNRHYFVVRTSAFDPKRTWPTTCDKL